MGQGQGCEGSIIILKNTNQKIDNVHGVKDVKQSSLFNFFNQCSKMSELKNYF